VNNGPAFQTTLYWRISFLKSLIECLSIILGICSRSLAARSEDGQKIGALEKVRKFQGEIIKESKKVHNIGAPEKVRRLEGEIKK